MKILIADDAATIRNLLRNILSEAGFHDFVFTADGAETLARLSIGDIDLALIDFHMPKMSGLEVVRALRREGCRIPLLMVTGESAMDQVRAAMAAGVDQYVVKPFKPELLVDRIYRAVTVRRDDEPDWRAQLVASLASLRPVRQF